MKAPRFEVVGNYQVGFHARYIARNGEPVWWTEKYKHKDGARHAVRQLRRNAATATLYDRTRKAQRLAG